MGNRLTKIYTRSGDDGTTGTADGLRVNKDSVLMEATGELDELNSCLGLVLAQALPPDVVPGLQQIQHTLFNIGAEISGSKNFSLPSEAVLELEENLDAYNDALPPLREFILPGGSQAAALCHLSRAVCRRVERRLVALHRESPPLNLNVLKYINRLSDFLFVLARVLMHEEGGADIYWDNPLKKER